MEDKRILTFSFICLTWSYTSFPANGFGALSFSWLPLKSLFNRQYGDTFEKSLVPGIYYLPSLFKLDKTCIFLTGKTCLMSFDIISTQISICWKAINGTENHSTQLEGLLEILIPHINLVFPQFSQVFNQWSEIHINIIPWLPWTSNHNTKHYVLSLHAQPMREVVNH